MPHSRFSNCSRNFSSSPFIAITAWVIDYNTARPHDSLGKDTTPAEARAAALYTHNLAA